MTAPTKKIFAAGLEGCRVYQVTSGTTFPNATSATIYEGLLLGGPMSLSVVPFGAPEKIAHPGNNYIQQTSSFKGADPATGTLTGSREDLDLLAALMGVKVYTQQEIHALPISAQANPIDVWLKAYAYTGTYSDGVPVCKTYIMFCTMYPNVKDMVTRDRSDVTYELAPISLGVDIAGQALTVANHGVTVNNLMIYESTKRLHVVASLGDNTATDFSFAATRQAAGTTYIVTADGTELTGAAITKATSKFTPAVKPTAGVKLVCIYEMADDAVDID
jgi:hypothetical protein